MAIELEGIHGDYNQTDNETDVINIKEINCGSWHFEVT